VRYTGIRKTAVLKVTVLYAVGWLNTSVYRLAALTASIFFHGHNIYLTILSICNDDVMKYGRISASRYFLTARIPSRQLTDGAGRRLICIVAL